jgi:tRNA (adenine57-N1/adenine58-N1)-methyltransferase
MPVVIYKPERKVVVDGHERVISRHEQWYVANTERDFHCSGGIIRKEQLQQGGKVKVGNNEFIIIPATFLDNYKAMRRDAQIITRKDLGFIIGFCGVTKESVVLESGAGSGSATIVFSSICKKVYSYEIDKENIEVVEENLKRLKVKNAVVEHKDMYDPKNVKVKDVDLVLLDLPEPWKALESARKAVKVGGYIVAYTPSITQAAKFVHALDENYIHERTTEIIDRDWRIKGDAVRPVTADIGHTAFLTIIRRIL